jgi:peptidoglycan/LPS O-acetylase OafA/YrhL
MRGETYLGATMAAWFMAGGALLYWAAAKRYSVGWRIYVGAFLGFFGFVGAAIEADNIVNLRAEEPVFGFVLAGAFVVAGFLLARSGYWRNVRRASDRSGQPIQAATGWTGGEPVSQAHEARSEEMVGATGSVREQ